MTVGEASQMEAIPSAAASGGKVSRFDEILFPLVVDGHAPSS